MKYVAATIPHAKITNRSSRHTLWIAAILYAVAALPGVSGEPMNNREEFGQWVMTYYLHPDPEHFVERVQSMSTIGVLHDSAHSARPDANVMFLGKLMAANPKRIREWMEALASLPAQDRAVLNRAVWYSGTAEGNAWLEDHDEAALAKGPRPLLLAETQVLNLKPHHLDQLWEWFFATGEEQPVARIVELFSLAHEPPRKDSFDLLPPPTKPAGGSSPKVDVQQHENGEVFKMDDESLYDLRMRNYQLLQPALWSCTSLAIQQDRVLEILKKMESSHHHSGIKAWLAQIIKIAEAERAKSGRLGSAP